MTAFSPSDIPSTINTLEGLSVWVSTCMQHINPELTVVEAPGLAERAATSAPYFITATEDFQWRNIARQSIPLSPNWQRTGKIWVHALPISTDAIPVDFKS